MRAWCPECYEEWEETNQIVYEPLLWSLETVCWCSRHRRQLQWHCPYPDCQRMMHPLTRSSLPGYCAHCKRWLGSSSSQQSEYDDLLTDEIREMQIWAADAVGELLTAASFMMVPPNREGIAKSLTHFVQEVMKGNRAAAARQLGIDRDAIGKWMQKTQRPLLESLVNVSFRLGTTLLGLLTGDVTSDITIEKTSAILE